MIATGGRTWAIDEIPSPVDAPLPMPKSSSSLQPQQLIDPPSVVTQHAQPPRRFVILSTHGVQIVQKLRSAEQLKALLTDCGGPDAEQIKAFFRLHKVC